MALKLSTEAMARASARRPWVTIGIWVIVLILAGFLAAIFLQDALTTEARFTNNPESKLADELLEKRLRGPRKVNEIVIAKSDSFTVDDSAFQGQVEKLYGEILALGSDVVVGGVNYYQTRNPFLVSADRHTTIMPFVMSGTVDAASKNIHKVLEVVHKANGDSGFKFLIAGQASIGEDFRKLADKDLQRGELLGIPAALIILVLVFGALTAAVIPVILSIIAIVVAVGVSAVIGQGFQPSLNLIQYLVRLTWR